MRIDSSEFCSITLDRARFSTPSLTCRSGKVARRTKKHSSKYLDSSPTICGEDARFAHEGHFDALVPGAGQSGNVPVSPEARQGLQHLSAGRSARLRRTPSGLITQAVAKPRPLARPT